MELEHILNFFKSLSYARKKYPIYLSYLKYLQNIQDEDIKTKEVNLMKAFLIANPNIKTHTLDCSYFKTGKNSIILYMTNFLIEPQKHVFWDSIQELEKNLFPFGKPELLEDDDSKTTNSVLEKFKSNRLLSDVLSQIQDIDTLQNLQNINDLLKCENFQNIITTISTNLRDGKYNLEDITNLTTSVTEIINELPKESIDEQTRESLSVVCDTMERVESHQPIDINKLMKAVSLINVNKNH